MTHTAQDLLAAVGVNESTGGTCPHGHRLFMGGEYTGPALGTPELDAILLVAGFKWMCKNGRHEAHVHLHDELPGHALAEAIREVDHA